MSIRDRWNKYWPILVLAGCPSAARGHDDRTLLGRAGRPRCVTLLLLATLLVAGRARAVDTLEPFGKGASDFELYVGSDGLGRRTVDAGPWTALQLGYGLSERLSAYLNGTASSDTFFRVQDKSFGVGLFGTVLDATHLDLDLWLDVRLSGMTLSNASLAPGLELNVDYEPFGWFLTAREVASGRERAEAAERQAGIIGTGARPAETGDEQGPKAQRVFDTELGVGGYWTVAKGHQLLVFFDYSVHHRPEDGQRRNEVGGIAVGYNAVVHDGVELINEVRLDVPRRAESPSFGISTGIIASF